MAIRMKQEANDALVGIAQSLDIAPSKYKEAMERYASLKEHLEGKWYVGGTSGASVYLQGSFRLGTVVRPYKDGKDRDYDIDMVCELGSPKEATDAREVKENVGVEVKNYAGKHSMRRPKDKRRCWTLEYAPGNDGIGFHMDVLPCVPDRHVYAQIASADMNIESYAQTTVAITNRDDDVQPAEYSWRSSNPHGYAEWFHVINLPGFAIFGKEQKHVLFENNRGIYANAEDVPDELVRTPLQRVIQILKRHRDVYFAGHKWEKRKPISMIITTLAGRLYEGRADQLRSVDSALTRVVDQLIAHASLLEPGGYLSKDLARMRLIERVGDKWYIPNPVNPHLPGDPDEKGENFADRWDEDNHVGARAFFEWVQQLRVWFAASVNEGDMYKTRNRLMSGLEVGLGGRALNKSVRSDKRTETVYTPVRLSTRPDKSWAM
jgi:hypothetical protein